MTAKPGPWKKWEANRETVCPVDLWTLIEARRKQDKSLKGIRIPEPILAGHVEWDAGYLFDDPVRNYRVLAEPDWRTIEAMRLFHDGKPTNIFKDLTTPKTVCSPDRATALRGELK